MVHYRPTIFEPRYFKWANLQNGSKIQDPWFVKEWNLGNVVTYFSTTGWLLYIQHSVTVLQSFPPPSLPQRAARTPHVTLTEATTSRCIKKGLDLFIALCALSLIHKHAHVSLTYLCLGTSETCIMMHLSIFPHNPLGWKSPSGCCGCRWSRNWIHLVSVKYITTIIIFAHSVSSFT